MKIGTNDISDCKLGNTQINKVYLGNNLVWSNSSLGNGIMFTGDFFNSRVDFPTISWGTSDEFTIAFFWKSIKPYNGTFNHILSLDATNNFLTFNDTIIRLRLNGVTRQANYANCFDGNLHCLVVSRDSGGAIHFNVDGVEIGVTGADTNTLSFNGLNKNNSLVADGFIISHLVFGNEYNDNTAAQAFWNNGEGALATDVFSGVERYYRLNQDDKNTLVVDDLISPANNGTMTGSSNTFKLPPNPWRNIQTPNLLPTFNGLKISLAGQSNAVGQLDSTGRPAGVGIDFSNSVCYTDGVQSPMYYGNVGINDYSDYIGKFGVEWRITQKFTDNSENVGWFKYAQGGTSVGTGGGNDGFWGVGGERTLGFIANAQAMGFVPDWFIWIQGEDDATDLDNANNYQTNLLATFNKIKTDLNTNMKILIIRLYNFPNVGTYASTIQTAQDNLAAGDANIFILNPATDAGVIGSDVQVDGIHYNHSGIDKIATECYNIIAAN